MVKKQIYLLVLSGLISLQSIAAENLYSIFSAGYSDVEFNQHSNEGFGYKMALGYQFDRQWYVEMGYQQLVHQKLYVADSPTAQDVTSGDTPQQADALFLAFLGKASGPMGELFYRVGILKTDIRGQQLLAGARECELGQASALTIADFGSATLCNYDEGGVAGVIGLGFDYFVGARSMLRAEIEYIKGQDNLTVTSLNLGFRYNF